jgi:hypothetical protein
VPFAGTQMQARGFDGLGYRYEFDAMAPGEHLTLAINDQFQPAANFLGTTKVDRDPAHVTYVENPPLFFSHVGTTADHAYWLSGIGVRDASGSAPIGTIDVRSQGFGVGDPKPSDTQVGGGTLTGGQIPAIGYNSQAKTWGPAPKTSVADVLDITATNVGSVTVDVQRARVDCAVRVNAQSDGPLKVALAGCNRTLSFAGNPRAAACRDTTSPRSRLSTRGLRRLSPGRVRLRGTASDRSCGKKRGKVVRVLVSVARIKKNGCQFVQRNGKLTRTRSCNLPVLLRAKGTARWSLTLAHRLPRGKYRAGARAVDKAGNLEKPSARVNVIRFKSRG